MTKETENKELLILNPFELPDVRLTLETMRAGAFPVLHLGRDIKNAEKSLEELSSKTNQPFGVCFASEELTTIKLPVNVTKVLLPYGVNVSFNKEVEILHQIHSLKEAKEAINEKVSSIVIKGVEGAGKVAQESSFILFQGIMETCRKEGIKVYIQGGAGIHTSAAYLALGAQGIIFDSQMVTFPECSAPKEVKEICSKLNGSEISIIDGFRVLTRKNSPVLPKNPRYKDLLPFLNGYNLSYNYLPMGQDIALSIDLSSQHKKLRDFVFAFYEALHGHILQAKKLDIIGPNSPLAKEFGTKYPITQGPMARVSDVPEFVKKVADAGALPFLALSVMKGDYLHKVVTKTAELMGDQVWGISIFGFNLPEVFQEQSKIILETKPKVVLIAGGHAGFVKQFIEAGIKTFFQVPSEILLDQYIKDGATNFIFEGRESGGHIGPFWSTFFWEKQINRLIREDDLTKFNIIFAGGIHDAFSSAFVSIMAAGLAVRGAKIGVQMGTSYLYTKEIVKTGAITPLYQKLSVKTDRTTCIESVPGQVSRVIPSPFIDYFTQEKQKKLAEGTDSLHTRISLEDIIAGRLRLASKGIERQGDKFVNQTESEQYEKGMYMIGDVAILIDKLTTLEKLHTSVAEDHLKIISKIQNFPIPSFLSHPVDIAVIGMECILPEASNIDEYWRNIVTGKDCIIEVPDIRWNKSVFYKPDSLDTDFLPSKTGGFVPDIDFDPMEFGLTPQSIASIEPLQLLSLLVAKRALENAGYNDLTADESENTSVIFAGEGLTDLAARIGFRSSYRQYVNEEIPEALKKKLPTITSDTFAGLLSNCTPGRISNRLNLRGRNFTVNSACASTLTALNIACKELSHYESDMIVLGGDDFHSMLTDYLMFSSTHALSPNGYCASFDAKADGMTMGEGVGVIILKRLEDAERAGDKIFAVIKGVGSSSDGKGLGLTAPNKEGQMLAMQRAYREAGISPSETELIEAHGTGTVVGDRTEFRSTSSVFWDCGAIPGQTFLGTVKSQIGHTKCAAGMSGLIRAILSVYHGVIPPTLHLEKPLELYNKKTSPFVFNSQAGIWTSNRRIAGISAFGFGGANGHAVIENYKSKVPSANTLKIFPTEMLVFRGDTLEEAKEKVEKVRKVFAVNNSLLLKDLAYSLAIESEKPIQIIAFASTMEELSQRILEISFDEKNADIYYRREKTGKVAFLFSGQGSQRINMARDLFVAFPAMRRLLIQNKEYEKIIFPPALFSETDKKEWNKIITDTRNAQPVLGIVDFAIAEYLRFLGIEPDMVAGHSYGELPALCFAGAFNPDKLVELSRKRAESILKAVGEDTGKMIAVGIAVEELNPLLKDEAEVWGVNFNSPKQTVLAGTSKGITAFTEKLSKQNIAYKEINVACAFHSLLLAKSQTLYADVLKNVAFENLRLPVWSNTTAEIYPQTGDQIKARMAEHLVRPVLFSREIEQMYADGARIFIETGPGNVLISLAQSILGKDITTIQIEAKEKEGISFFLHALAQYLATGKTFNIGKLFEGRDAKFIDINQPEKYRKSRLTWLVNGQYARPIEGELPEVGGLPFAEPLGLKLVSKTEPESFSSGVVPNTTHPSDQVMMEYLASVRLLIQNQRDVMLSYYGQHPQEFLPRPMEHLAITPSEPVKSIASFETAKPSTLSQPKFLSGLSIEQITMTLLNVVSEKTGYPIEMLGMDLDLEADLSIDSIKRMEIVGDLKDRLNMGDNFENAEEAFFKMASLKTLNELIHWVEEISNQLLQTYSIEETAPSQPVEIASHDEQITNQPPDIESVKKILLEVVSNKTGYPVEMLGLDLDLEADLSIDSIKRMEIVGDLKDKLNFGDDIGNSEEAFFRMASLKTLNELIAWIEELNASLNNTAIIDSATEILDVPMEHQTTQKPGELSRILFDLKSYPLKPEKIPIKGKRFALTDDGGFISSQIQSLLEKAGAHSDIIQPDANLSSYDGLILMNATASPKSYTIYHLFNLIHGAALNHLKWVFTFSDILGQIESEKNLIAINQMQGFSGLFKTLMLEYPEVRFRAVLSYTLFDKETLPSIVMDELTVDDAFPEIIYKGAERLIYSIRMEDLVPDETNATTNLKLDNDSVVLVLGGAQGISPELIAQLAAEYPCRYLLVGRSEQLDDSKGVYAHLKTRKDIRTHLITIEGMKKPSEIEKKIQKIFKSNQITETIARIEKTGARVFYRPIDITNHKNFKEFLQSVKEEYGKIDAIIHAAGLLHDKFFADKTLESFEKVYQTKINPLHTILEEIDDNLKLLILFSSVASSSGNKGQSDYTAANSVFDFTASLNGIKPGLRIIAFNWGPWKGAGMVSESLEAEFTKRGISLIPLKEGGEYFVQELKYGKASRIIVMGGKEEVENFFKKLN